MLLGEFGFIFIPICFSSCLIFGQCFWIIFSVLVRLTIFNAKFFGLRYSWHFHWFPTTKNFLLAKSSIFSHNLKNNPVREIKKSDRWKVVLLKQEIESLKRVANWHRLPTISRQILAKQNQIKAIKGEKQEWP